MNIEDAIRGIAELLGIKDELDTVRSIRKVLDAIAGLQNNDLPDDADFLGASTYKAIDGVDLTLDVIKPKGNGPFPVLVYIHGGAWISGSPATHRKLTYRLAEQGFLTLSVDYRLAPEHPFPAAFDDCVDAIGFAFRNASRWGGDPDRLVIAGDSAGGNLAAAAAVELAGQVAAPRIRAIGLLYGVYDFSRFEPDGITGLLLDAYLGPEKERLIRDPRVSPILKAASLPPAYIAVGSADDLIEDSEALRAKLARAGRVHDYHVYEDMPHAFMQMEFLSEALTSIRRMTNFLHEIVSQEH